MSVVCSKGYAYPGEMGGACLCTHLIIVLVNCYANDMSDGMVPKVPLHAMSVFLENVLLVCLLYTKPSAHVKNSL